MAMVEVDVVAVVDLCTRFLPGMVERGRGAVLNVASTAAFQPLPGQAAYAAGKAFVLSYTHSLVGELRGTGVTATALCPGPVKTGVRRGGRLHRGAGGQLAARDHVGRRRGGRQGRRRGLDKGRCRGDPGRGQQGGRVVRPGDAARRCWCRSWPSSTPACTDPRHRHRPGQGGSTRSREDTMRRRTDLTGARRAPSRSPCR